MRLPAALLHPGLAGFDIEKNGAFGSRTAFRRRRKHVATVTHSPLPASPQLPTFGQDIPEDRSILRTRKHVHKPCNVVPLPGQAGRQ